MIIKLMLPTPLIIFFSFASQIVGVPDIEPTGFEDLARNSSQILIGRVVRIHSVNGVRVAETQVIESFKGNPNSKTYFLAQPSWMCDITSASVGKSYLLFLHSFDSIEKRHGSAAFLGIKDLRRFVKEIRRRTGDSLLVVAHAGRGEMVISKTNDAVAIWTDDVILPKRITTLADSERTGKDFIRWAALKDVVTYLKEIIATQ